MNPIQLPTPLVSIDWLNENINHPDLVILNATLPKVGNPLPETVGKIEIPNARIFDLKNTFKNLEAKLPNTMPGPEYFSKEVQKLGIHKKSKIVIYDHHGIYSSPRAWWIFRVMGHQDVAVLDGGLPAWKNKNLTISSYSNYQGNAGDFVARFQPHLLTDAKEVLQNLDKDDISILDARSEGRFNGTAPEPRAYLKGGHIPGSQNLPISKIIQEGKMISKEELNEIYNTLNVMDKKLVLTCGSGVTACVIALGAEVAGHQNKTVYDGSWTEWGDGDDYPIEK